MLLKYSMNYFPEGITREEKRWRTLPGSVLGNKDEVNRMAKRYRRQNPGVKVEVVCSVNDPDKWRVRFFG